MHAKHTEEQLLLVQWLGVELCKLSLQASKKMFVFIKCNRASQDIDTFLILKKMTPSQAILDCHKKYLSLHLYLRNRK